MLTYLGWMLDKSDNDLPVVHHNIQKAQQVWGRLGKLLRREGVDSFVLDIFYRAVVKIVLLFRSETWVLFAAMTKRMEGFHVGLLGQVTGKTSQHQWDGTWKMEGG